MKISEAADEVKILLSARRVWPLILLQSVFVVGIMAAPIRSAVDPLSWAFVALLISVVGAWFLCILSAKESILYSQREFCYKLHFGPFTFRHNYNPEEVSNFRIFSRPEVGQDLGAEGTGKLCFDHKGKTHRFGILVAAGEIDQILAALRRATS